jgi:transcriptional regulator with XRE-family HTH domain
MFLTLVQWFQYTTFKINAEVQMERIRQLRKERGLSQVKLAVMADMDPATLNRLERGTGNPNLRTLERVAQALGVEVAELLPKVVASPSQRRLFNGEERRAFIERCERYVEGRVAYYENRLAETADFTGAKTLQDYAFEEFSQFLDLTNGEAVERWLEDPAIPEAVKEELAFDLAGVQRPFMRVVGRIGDRENELADTPAEKDEAERSVVNLEEYFRSHRAG